MSPRARSGGSGGADPRTLASPPDDRQRRAAELLGRGRTQVEAARAAGVTPRTVRDWRRRPGFEELVAEARAALAAASDPAERTLREALHATTPDGAADWPTRVRAARLLRLPAPGGASERPPPEEAVHLTIRRGDGWIEATRQDTGEAVRHVLGAPAATT